MDEDLDKFLSTQLNLAYDGSWEKWQRAAQDASIVYTKGIRNKLFARCYQLVQELWESKKAFYLHYNPSLKTDLSLFQQVLLPRIAKTQQCLAVYALLRTAKGQGRLNTESYNYVAEWCQKYLKPRFDLALGPIVCRETLTSIYFTYSIEPKPPTTPTTLKTYTDVIVQTDGGQIALCDVFRSIKCSWEEPIACGNFADVVNRMYASNTDRKPFFVHLRFEHKQDWYVVQKMTSIDTSFDTLDSSDSFSSGIRIVHATTESIPAAQQVIVQELAKPYLSWSSENFSSLDAEDSTAFYYISNLYKQQPVNLDKQYMTYCDANAAPVCVDDTAFMRDMQIQERTLAVAGMMACRYDNVANFAAKMQVTARANSRPMSLDETIRTLSQLDIRRGPGTFSSYIQVPPSTVQAADPLQTLPMLQSTWKAFFDNFNQLDRELEAHD